MPFDLEKQAIAAAYAAAIHDLRDGVKARLRRYKATQTGGFRKRKGLWS